MQTLSTPVPHQNLIQWEESVYQATSAPYPATKSPGADLDITSLCTGGKGISKIQDTMNIHRALRRLNDTRVAGTQWDGAQVRSSHPMRRVLPRTHF